jgi:hypothetical protein
MGAVDLVDVGQSISIVILGVLQLRMIRRINGKDGGVTWPPRSN